MKIIISNSAKYTGIKAAQKAAEIIKQYAKKKKEVNIVIATGTSQLNFYKELINISNIPWHIVNIFHLDEYIGVSKNHSASFRIYLESYFLSHISYKSFNPIIGDSIRNPFL